MTNANFSVNDIHIVCNFMVFRDIQAINDLTAAADIGVINNLTDKIDPSILSVTEQALTMMNQVSTNVTTVV